MKNKFFLPLISLTTALSLVACNEPQNALSHARELRNPSGLSHERDYGVIGSEEYFSFKSKLKTFAAKISDSFASREYSDGDNIAISPLSIELCLGLAIRSTEGDTRQELLNAFDVDYATFNRFYKIYFNELFLEKKDDVGNLMSQILLTNSIWIDNDIKLKDSGLDALRDDYYCYSYEVDFDNDNANANKAMEEFIKKMTNGFLNPKLNIPDTTIFALMNTLYLKDVWNDVGADLAYASTDYQFTYKNGSKSSKRLLDGYHFSGKAMEKDNYTSFYTSTKSGFRLYFIKPNDNVDIKYVFNQKNIEYATNLNNYVVADDVKLEKYYTKCVFPEFKANCDLILNEMLMEDFNIKKIFNLTESDFSNLSYVPAYCSEVKHISKLEVNKKGIEGAAVTIMTEAGAAGPGEYKEVYETFVIDKEFGYVLTYRDSILFSGIVTNID